MFLFFLEVMSFSLFFKAIANSVILLTLMMVFTHIELLKYNIKRSVNNFPFCVYQKIIFTRFI